MKTTRQIASKIAKIEGKKSQSRMGDIMEIVGIISDLLFEGEIETDDLYEIGYKRHVKKEKKVKNK